MNQRISNLRNKMKAQNLKAVLINNLKNVYYLTNFWGSNGTALVTEERVVLFTDSRYTIHAHATCFPFVEIVETRDELTAAAEIVKDLGIKELGFEDEVTVAYHARMASVFSGITLQSLANFVMELRLIKDETEIAAIKKACIISDQAFHDILDYIKVGQTTELEAATFLDFRMRELGASGVSFDIISAAGERSAMPHATPSDRVISAGDALTLDFGCLYNHYVSDMTRTIYAGHVSDKEREIYETVLKANQALIDAAKDGLGFRDFDKIPRDVIERAGYGQYFTHGIGHGIGLDIHEEPYFSQTSKEAIQAGMVLTDEPGIYIEGLSGVRIEDDLLITETGCEVLTLAPKELIVL